MQAPILRPLTGVRFIAALGVVCLHLGHFALAGESGALGVLVSRGALGVSLFFILSGFILVHTYLEHDVMRTDSVKFWWARAARLYPVYVLGFIIVAPFVAVPLYRHSGAWEVVLTAAATLLFVQAWVPALAWRWNGVAWSVSVEAFFYLVFPWMAPRLARLSGSMIVVGILLAILSAFAPAAVVWAYIRWIEPGFSVDIELEKVLSIIPVLRLPQFALGVLVGVIFARWPTCSWGAWVSCASMLIVVGGLLLFPTTQPSALLLDGLLTPLLALLLLGLAWGGGPLAWLLSRRVLVLLGEASYSLYILHMAVVPWLVYLHLIPENLELPLISFVVSVLGMVALSVLVFLLVEQPTSRWLRLRLMVERHG